MIYASLDKRYLFTYKIIKKIEILTKLNSILTKRRIKI